MSFRSSTRDQLSVEDFDVEPVSSFTAAEDYADLMGWEAVPIFDPADVSREDVESWAQEYADEYGYDIHDVFEWLYGYADEPG